VCHALQSVTRFLRAAYDLGADALLVDLERPDEEEYGLRIIEELRSDPELVALPVILCTAAAEEVRPLLERWIG
jgi:CheY-like chemotaxis protein